MKNKVEGNYDFSSWKTENAFQPTFYGLDHSSSIEDLEKENNLWVIFEIIIFWSILNNSCIPQNPITFALRVAATFP